MEIKPINTHHSALQTGWLTPTLVTVSTLESICPKEYLAREGLSLKPVSTVRNRMSQSRFTLDGTSSPNYVLYI